jgi:hypothetical protein
MQFVGALDPIFILAIAWKVLDHLIDATWHKPTDCRVEGYKLSDLEFVRAHIRVAHCHFSVSSSISSESRHAFPGTHSGPLQETPFSLLALLGRSRWVDELVNFRASQVEGPRSGFRTTWFERLRYP